MEESKYVLTGKYLDGSSFFERLTEPEARSSIDWIFRTNNKIHPFGSSSTVVDWRTLIVEIDIH